MASFGWHHLSQRDKVELLRRIRAGEGGSGPFHVEIHPADRCNIDCFFCSTSLLRGTDEVPLRSFADFLHELRRGGGKSLRLAGGGEPLFHRQIVEVFRAIREADLAIENLTTNGVLLTDKILPSVVDGVEEVTLSLNTADPETYQEMMRTPAKNFERVVRNAKKLVAERRRLRRQQPALRVQFLVWKLNFKSVERMYDLAREIGADSIVFNGLSHLQPAQLMSEAETSEMMDGYRRVVRRDGYRTIDVISSFEQDLRPRVAAMNAELHQERVARPLVSRAAGFFFGGEFSLAANIRHRARLRQARKTERAVSGYSEACLMGWYTMLVRTSGDVGPCCVMQGKPLGNVYRQGLSEVWNGAPYESFRRELHNIMAHTDDWELSGSDRFVEPLCGGRTAGCPVSNFYRHDAEFMTNYQEVLREAARGLQPA